MLNSRLCLFELVSGMLVEGLPTDQHISHTLPQHTSPAGGKLRFTR